MELFTKEALATLRPAKIILSSVGDIQAKVPKFWHHRHGL
jgi:hypothetical protein